MIHILRVQRAFQARTLYYYLLCLKKFLFIVRVAVVSFPVPNNRGHTPSPFSWGHCEVEEVIKWSRMDFLFPTIQLSPRSAARNNTVTWRILQIFVKVLWRITRTFLYLVFPSMPVMLGPSPTLCVPGSVSILERSFRTRFAIHIRISTLRKDALLNAL